MADRREPTAAIFLCALGLTAAAGAWVIGERGLEKAARIREGWSLKRVIVAAADLPAGHVLTREDLASRDVPEQLVTPSLFTDTRPLEGRPIARRLSAGTPVHVAFLEVARVACAEAP